MKHTLTLFINSVRLITISFFFSTSLFAQWSEDPSINNSICTVENAQASPKIISDENGGAIITWIDLRNGNDYDIYAQKVNNNGETQWVAGGVPICTAIGNQLAQEIISDQNGGAIITWEDVRGNGDIYAQHINSNGIVDWTNNGVAICIANGTQSNPSIISDNDRGAIIAWEDNRNGTVYKVYAQRIGNSGSVLWTNNGILLAFVNGEQGGTKLTTDGQGGAIITWNDQRNGSFTDIYAQRISLNGNIMWNSEGIAIGVATSYQSMPSIVSDGLFGAIISWEDYRNGETNSDIFVQKINKNGEAQWAINGVNICNTSSNQNYPIVTSDNIGGAIITWHDYRNSINSPDIFAQKIDSNGVIKWLSNGEEICISNGTQNHPMIISDNENGAIITWNDNRNGNFDIYAQRISEQGIIQWPINGLQICSASNDQMSPELILSNQNTIITWYDYRNGNTGNDVDIYASRISQNGSLPVELTSFFASSTSNNIQLNWKTATESNNVGWEIESRQNPLNPPLKNGETDSEWKKIGFVSGKGTTTEAQTYSFSLPITHNSSQVFFRLKQIDTDGKFSYSKELSVNLLPETYSLSQNYPNPFNPNTTINYALPKSGKVVLKVYDVLGKEIAVLENGFKESGRYSVNFDGSSLSSGIYFYKLESGGFSQVKKFQLVK